MLKITHNCYAKNVKNHAIFVEEFWPEFYARGSFMKYSMSVEKRKMIYAKKTNLLSREIRDFLYITVTTLKVVYLAALDSKT